MLVVELKKVVEIDQKISDLHKQLEGLYSMRSNLVRNDVSNVNDIKSITTELASNKLSEKFTKMEIFRTYKKLNDAWLAHGVKLPPLSQLEKRLKSSLTTVESLKHENPLIAQRLIVVIIPPKSAYDFKKFTLKSVKTLYSTVDYKFASGVSIKQPKAGWKVMLVYADKCGLLPDEVDVNAYDKLNVATYLSLQLQEQTVFDAASWTLLPGSPKGNDEIVSVCFNGTSYVFELDDKHNPIGDNRIRPVIEIGNKNANR